MGMNVTVLGAGSWGTTVASLTAARHDTTLWARDPLTAEEVDRDHTNERYLAGLHLSPRLRGTADLEQALTGADVVIMGIPSASFRSVLIDARPAIRPWVPIVSLTKGIERDSLLRMTQVIEELMPGHPAAALSGPNLAREILSGQAAASVIATEDLGVAAALQQVLRHKLFRVYMNHDVIGCEVGGALKNVIAIAAGIAQGLGVGDNTRAAVITRGLAELTRLGVAMGAEAQTLSGLAGMGDLMATCISPLSRNRTVGELLGRGRSLGAILEELHMVAEGVATAGVVQRLAERYDVELPICAEISSVVQGEKAAIDAYRGLRIEPGHESDPG